MGEFWENFTKGALGQKLINLVEKQREIRLNSTPENSVINDIIAMGEDIAHADNLVGLFN